jgi:hypothetical protein
MGGEMMLIAFDVDGTLADISHRLPWIERDPKDWDTFYDRCEADSPIRDMIALCNMFLSNQGVYTIFVSGRTDRVRAKTVKWLTKHLAPLSIPFPSRLYMRSQGDRRPDYKVKLDLLHKIEADYGAKPDVVFDDRQQVVDMWRANGVRCCQVAPGDF